MVYKHPSCISGAQLPECGGTKWAKRYGGYQIRKFVIRKWGAPMGLRAGGKVDHETKIRRFRFLLCFF